MKRIPTLLSLVALACLPLLGGCGGDSGGDGGNPAAEPLADSRYADLGPTKIRFTDISAQAGVTAVNHSGRAGLKEWLLEAVGPGAACLDYDQDGLIDIYIPDGDVLSNYERAVIEDPTTGRTRTVLRAVAQRKESYRDQLWRNNGDGTFTDVAAQAGILEERWSYGATTFDYDADGDVDIHVANFGYNTLWRNNGDGTFTDVAEQLKVRGDPWTWNTCAAVGDLDGDGRVDLYVASFSDPAAEVERLRSKQGLPTDVNPASVSGRDCRWRGIMAYCGPRGLEGQFDVIYRQTEDGTFEDVTKAWGAVPRVAKYGFTTLMFDFNEDGLLDVYVANDSVENFMWQQERGPGGEVLFRDTSDTLGIKVGNQVSAQASMGADVADIDGDGRLDIFVTNFSHDFNNLYLAKRVGGAEGPVYFKDRGLQTMGQQVYYDLSWGCGWNDFDNDGDLDLYVANGHVYKEIDLFEKTGASFDQLNALFECIDDRNLGYREIGAKGQKNAAKGANTDLLDAGDGMAVARCSRQTAFLDFNNDGLIDMLVMNMNAAPTVLLNTSKATDANWVKFSLRQAGGNRDALGAVVDVHYGPPGQRKTRRLPNVRVRSFLGCNDPRLHAGLGPATTCDVTVTWPGTDRAKTEYKGLDARKHWLLDRESGEASPLAMPTFPVK